MTQLLYFDHYKYFADLAKFKYPFPGSSGMVSCYGESAQDLFVITLLKGKRRGFYIELGSRHPINKSNTYMLERDFDWDGFSIDRDENYYELFKRERKNPTYLCDALTFDFREFNNQHVDYLSADLDRPATYVVVRNILDSGILPSIITFEHDNYNLEDNEPLDSEYVNTVLSTYGYMRIVKGGLTVLDHEDWYVLPDRVDLNLANKLSGGVYGSTDGPKKHFFNE